MGQRGPRTRCVLETSEFRVGLQGAQAAVGGRDPAPVVALDDCRSGTWTRYANLEPSQLLLEDARIRLYAGQMSFSGSLAALDYLTVAWIMRVLVDGKNK